MPIIALSALGCFAANAQDITLRYGLDFDDESWTNVADMPGNGTFRDRDKSGEPAVWSSDADGKPNGHSHVLSQETFLLTEDSAGALGTTSGFTFTFDVFNIGTGTASLSDSAVVSFRVMVSGYNNTFSVRTTSDGTGLCIYKTDGAGAGSTLLTVSNAVSSDSWSTVFLTLSDAEWTLSVYEKGTSSLISSTSLEVDAEGQLNYLPTAGTLAWAQGGDPDAAFYCSADVAIDNFGVYDGVLTSADMVEVAQKGLVQSLPVPEPATATLSLLALAGLAARRRRK